MPDGKAVLLNALRLSLKQLRSAWRSGEVRLLLLAVMLAVRPLGFEML